MSVPTAVFRLQSEPMKRLEHLHSIASHQLRLSFAAFVAQLMTDAADQIEAQSETLPTLPVILATRKAMGRETAPPLEVAFQKIQNLEAEMSAIRGMVSDFVSRAPRRKG
jgi:hypothetical protein